jgi:hypothetical protein
MMILVGARLELAASAAGRKPSRRSIVGGNRTPLLEVVAIALAKDVHANVVHRDNAIGLRLGQVAVAHARSVDDIYGAAADDSETVSVDHGGSVLVDPDA